MSKQYLKKLKGTDTPIATRYKPAFSDSEYTGFGELYRNGKWYKDVAVFADDFLVDTSSEWTSIQSGSITVSDGLFKITNPSTTYGRASKSFSLTERKHYKLIVQYKHGTGASNVRIGSTQDGLDLYAQTGDTTSTSIEADFIAISTIYIGLGVNTNVSGEYSFYDSIAIIPLNDDGSIDISNATELTTPQTYLPIEVDVDEQGNLLNVDRMDFPTLVEDYVYAKNVKCDEANFVNGWKSEGMDAYACRAWVNFNGTGTVAIRASGNVSSITDHTIGQYTVNFTTAMPDANYSAVFSAQQPAGTGIASSGIFSSVVSGSYSPQNPTTSGYRILIYGSAGVDSAYILSAVFR